MRTIYIKTPSAKGHPPATTEPSASATTPRTKNAPTAKTTTSTQPATQMADIVEALL